IGRGRGLRHGMLVAAGEARGRADRVHLRWSERAARGVVGDARRGEGVLGEIAARRAGAAGGACGEREEGECAHGMVFRHGLARASPGPVTTASIVRLEEMLRKRMVSPTAPSSGARARIVNEPPGAAWTSVAASPRRTAASTCERLAPEAGSVARMPPGRTMRTSEIPGGGVKSRPAADAAAVSTAMEIAETWPGGGAGAMARPRTSTGAPSNTSPMVTAGPLASTRARRLTGSASATVAPKSMYMQARRQSQRSIERLLSAG